MAQYYVKKEFWIIFLNSTILSLVGLISIIYRSFFNKYQLIKAQPILSAKIIELETELKLIKEREPKEGK